MGSWSFGLTSICLMVLLPLNYIWIPYLVHVHLMLSPRPWTYGITICPILGLPPEVVDAWLLPLDSGVIYSYQCGAIYCREEYISETARILGERYKEHLRESSPIQVYSQSSRHPLSQDNFYIIGREGQDLTRVIKESIYIRVNNPTLNRNIGKFQLHHIWNRVLFSTPYIKVAIPTGNVQHSP